MPLGCALMQCDALCALKIVYIVYNIFITFSMRKRHFYAYEDTPKITT